MDVITVKVANQQYCEIRVKGKDAFIIRKMVRFFSGLKDISSLLKSILKSLLKMLIREIRERISEHY
jgi:hypothetical protein